VVLSRFTKPTRASKSYRVIEFLLGLLKAIPFLDKWFSKSPEQKERDRIEKRNDESLERSKKFEHAAEEGRAGRGSSTSDLIDRR